MTAPDPLCAVCASTIVLVGESPHYDAGDVCATCWDDLEREAERHGTHVFTQNLVARVRP